MKSYSIFRLTIFILLSVIFGFNCTVKQLNPLNEAEVGIKVLWGGNFTASWDGQIEVTGAQIIQLEPISFEKNQDNFFSDEKKWTSAVKRYPWQYRMYNKRQYNPIYQEVYDKWSEANLLSSTDGFYLWLKDVSESSQIILHFPDKSFAFSISTLLHEHEIRREIPEKGSVTVTLLVPYLQVTNGKTFSKIEHASKQGEKNEAPAMTVDLENNKWISWIRFTEDEQEDIYALCIEGNQVGLPERLSSNETQDFEPHMTCDSNGRIWVCWTAQSGINYSIRGKYRTENGWSEEQTISLTSGKNFHPSISADRSGGVWITWETYRNHSYVIIARHFDGSSWGKEIVVSDAEISSHLPVCTVDNKDVCWVVWEGACEGSYEICLRSISAQRLGDMVRLTQTIENEMRPVVAVDLQDRLWIAYHEVILEPTRLKTNPQKKVENSRRIMTVCYNPQTGDIYAPRPAVPRGTPGQVTPLGRIKFSTLLIDKEGIPWLFYREVDSRSFGRWAVTALCYAEDNWTNPLRISGDWGGVKYPLYPVVDNDNQIWVSWDNYNHLSKSQVNIYQFEDLKSPSNVLLAKCNLSNKHIGEPILQKIGKAVKAEITGSPEVPLFPHRTTTINGETYTLYYGNLHKHSQVSNCRRSGDGWLEDHYLFARDIRGIDFLMIADHSEHTDFYEWFRLNRASMLYNQAGDFIGFPGYEWTSEGFQPGECYGHYNPVFLIPDGEFVPLKYLLYSTRPPYKPDQMWNIFEEFKKNGRDVITIPHHPGRLTTAIDYRFYSKEFVPVIEIAQDRGSYEYHRPHEYAEPAVRDVVKQGHFVQDGLARGYEYGFVASGDHSGNQLAAVFAKSLSREDIFDAMKQRRCYATFGEKIFVDFRVNGVFMGGSLELDSPKTPRVIDIHVIGTDVIESIDIIKNNVDIVHHTVGEKEVTFSYTDNETVYDELTYYYIRVNQDKIEKAWASPVWINVSK